MTSHSPFTIAVLGDIHFGDPPRIAKRRGEYGATLLRRAVERFNRHIQPDLVLVLGDLLDQPKSEQAECRLQTLRGILDRLRCPYVVVPGNHDPHGEDFYRVIERPDEAMDFGGRVRVLPFDDPEEPGFHARRTENDLARLRGARDDGFAGVVISAQHVPIRPRGTEVQHTFTNLDEVLEAAVAGGVDLCIAGHSHKPRDPVAHGRCRCLTLGALCEHPHSYTLVTLDADDNLTCRSENLAMPGELGLIDCHSHTQYAYCGQTVDTEHSRAFAEMMNLGGLAFTEHSGQLYFSHEAYRRGRFCEQGVDGSRPADRRIEGYLQTVRAIQSPDVLLGLEVDVDFQGRQVLLEEHRAPLQLLVGAVHFLPESVKPAAERDPERFVAQFQDLTQTLCRTGIHILAHPFRIFRRSQIPVPERLFPWLANVLRETGVAAELNYHTNVPHDRFVELCLERNVKLSFGSDAHELWEIGEFYPHLQLLDRLGHTGDPREVLIDVPTATGVNTI